jgi:hypothetical protein
MTGIVRLCGGSQVNLIILMMILWLKMSGTVTLYSAVTRLMHAWWQRSSTEHRALINTNCDALDDKAVVQIKPFQWTTNLPETKGERKPH